MPLLLLGLRMTVSAKPALPRTARAVHARSLLSGGLCCSDIVKNKIAADEVGDDLRKVANTLSDAATQTERKVEKKVGVLSCGLPLKPWGFSSVSTVLLSSEDDAADVMLHVCCVFH